MSDEVIWKRLDDHAGKIDSLAIQQAEIRTEVRSLERHLHTQLSEVGTALARIESKIDNHSAYQNKQKGAVSFGIWVLGVSLTIVTVVTALWSTAFGS